MLQTTGNEVDLASMPLQHRHAGDAGVNHGTNVTDDTFYVSPSNGVDAIDVDDLSFYVIFYKLTVPTLFGLVDLIGIVGNVLVIYTVLSRVDMRRNAVNLLLLNLAGSDLAFLVICLPFISYHFVAENWIIGDFACKISQFLIYVTTYVTVYTLMAVAFVRVCKVSRAATVINPTESTSGRRHSTSTTRSCTAFRWRCYVRFFACGSWFPADGWDNRSRRFVATVVVTLWVVAMVCNVPVIFFYHVKNTSEENLEEIVISSTATTSTPYIYCGVTNEMIGHRFTLAFFTFAYLAPLASIATMYFRLLRQLHMKQRETSISSTVEGVRTRRPVVADSEEPGCSNQSTSATLAPSSGGGNGNTFSATTTATTTTTTRTVGWRTTRVTRVLVVVVAVFAICWLPLHVHLLVVYSGAQPKSRWYEIYRGLAHCLAYSNSCMNPVIYSYVSTDFRRQFAEIVFGAWTRTCRRCGVRTAGTMTGDSTIPSGNGAVEASCDVRPSRCRPPPSGGHSTGGRSMSETSGSSRIVRYGQRGSLLLSPPDVQLVTCHSKLAATTVTVAATSVGTDYHSREDVLATAL